MPDIVLPPYQPDSTEGSQPQEVVHPEVSKKCDDFVKAKIQEIGSAKLPADERAAALAFVKKSVVHIEHGSKSQVDGKLQTLDQQIKRYLKSPESEIPRSPPTSTPELQEFVEKRTHEKQLEAKVERLTRNYTNMLLDSLNKLSLRQETKLFASKIVQDHVVTLRHQYRQGAITEERFEASMKALPNLLRPIAERMYKLEKLEKKIDGVLDDITGSDRMRNILALRINKEIEAAKQQMFPNLESLDKLNERVENKLTIVKKVASYLSTNGVDVFIHEATLHGHIATSGLAREHIESLHEYSDSCMADLIDKLANGSMSEASVTDYLTAVELNVSEYIEKHTTA